MKYLQLICIEGETGTPEAAAAMREHVDPWVQETVARHINIVGKPLDDPASARTVRARDGETIVSDGPFAATKEFIGGLDLLDCANLDEAIEVASKHPVSWFHAIELRPFPDGVEIPAIDAEDLRYLLQVFADEAPEAPASAETIRGDGERWREAAGSALVFGSGLAPSEAATTVRVRDGGIQITDGPFSEATGWLAGVHLLNCEREPEAMELAARFPPARHHTVEVRRFVDL
ncbi:MAG TPA: YciI family protein [Solirubrobacteraceae bacterium]|nr:YciI family protein [Solirubrobacteraceae bacterium]